MVIHAHQYLQGQSVRIKDGPGRGLLGEVIGCDSVYPDVVKVAVPLCLLLREFGVNAPNTNVFSVSETEVSLICESKIREQVDIALKPVQIRG